MLMGSARNVLETYPPSDAKAQAPTKIAKNRMPSQIRARKLTGSRGRGIDRVALVAGARDASLALGTAQAEPGAFMAADGEERFDLIVAAAEAGERLDRLLARRLSGFSRSRLQALLRAGAVVRDGVEIRDLGHKVKAGEAYAVNVPAPEPAVLEPQAMSLAVVYEDGHLIVIDKPAGLVVHPGPGHASGTLVNALIAHCGDSLSGIGGVKRPGIVHRLDKDTSGLLVVAKTDRAHAGLAEQFAAHGSDGRLERAYLALVWGVPDRPRGVIEAALARSSANRTKIAVVSEDAGR